MDYVHPTHRNVVVGAGYSGSGFKVRSCSIDQYHLTTLIVYDRPFVQVYRSSLLPARYMYSRDDANANMSTHADVKVHRSTSSDTCMMSADGHDLDADALPLL